MSAIGLDILSIGSSKWNQDVGVDVNMGTDGAPANFMLPAAENVSATPSLAQQPKSLSYFNMPFCMFSPSLLSFAELISMQRKERIMTRK